jgi:hypothetical protein
VSARGAVVSAVSQHAQQTRFAFETGAQLRVKIVKTDSTETPKHEVKR